MSGIPTNYGRILNKEWNVNAQHALYHKEGTFYQTIKKFPGALFDPNGYVIFNTKEEYLACQQLDIGIKIHVKTGGIENIPGYIKKIPIEIINLKKQLDVLQTNPIKYSSPKILQKVYRILETYERSGSITRYVKKIRGATCQLCKQEGFLKRDGERYCEVHHLFHLSKNPPLHCLEPEYLIVLCATCHCKMHYGDVGEPVREEDGWLVRVGKDNIKFLYSPPWSC